MASNDETAVDSGYHTVVAAAIPYIAVPVRITGLVQFGAVTGTAGVGPHVIGPPSGEPSLRAKV